MDPSYDHCKCNDSSCRSMMTMETYDTTNNTSISSGVSLDMDVHGMTWATSPQLCHRSSHPTDKRVTGEFDKEYHLRGGESSGESFNTFGESFMMDSFANGESFSSSYNYEPSRHHQQRLPPKRLTDDVSSILIIEEECEEVSQTIDETGKYATPTETIRLNFGSAPNTFTDLSCQSTHG